MPRIEEVQHLLAGLWLLIQGKPEGFSHFDFSMDGLLRSFWAIVWTLPALAIAWAAWRLDFLGNMPPGTQTGPSYFLRLFVVEVISWVFPLVLIALLAGPLGFARLVVPIVITSNWLSVPLSYALAVPMALQLLFPAGGVIALLAMMLLFTAIMALFRLLRTVTGNQLLLATTLTVIFLLTPILIEGKLDALFGLVASPQTAADTVSP